MIRHILIRICFIVILTPLFLFTTAEEIQYKFIQFSINEGLSTNMTNCILQDSRGFIWTGTENGLNRYDGYDFKIFTCNEDSSSISGNQITALCEDKHGNIWVGTRKNGLNIYRWDLDSFESYCYVADDPSSISHNHITTIYEDKTGIIWVGTFGGGLNRFDCKTKSFSNYKQFPNQSENNADKINVIFEDSDGIFWIGTRNDLYIFDRSKAIFQSTEILNNILRQFRITNTICQDDQNNLWIGTWNGLVKYNKVNNDIQHYRREENNNRSLSAEGVLILKPDIIDGKHILWIGTSYGLNRLDIETSEITQFLHDTKNPIGISGNRISDLIVDNCGIVWIATEFTGINKLLYNRNPFHHKQLFSETTSLHYAANDFFMDRNGILWIGAHSGGLFKLNNKLEKIAQYKPDFIVPWNSESNISNYVLDIYEDINEKLWISFYGVGLTYFDRTSEQLVPVNTIQNSPEMPRYIMAITDDNQGRLWIGDYVKGLFYKNLNSNKSNPIIKVGHADLKKSQITSLLRDSSDRIWVGTKQEGLYCIDHSIGDSIRYIHYKEELLDSIGDSYININSLAENISGNIIIGTNKGLIEFITEKEVFSTIRLQPEYSEGSVLNCFSDSNGKLWIQHSTYGLLRYNSPSSKIKGQRQYSIKDGLPFENFSHNGFYMAPDGRIFIGASLGSSQGFFYFHPDSVYDNTHVPPVFITGINIRNQALKLDSNISIIKRLDLSFNENFFSFEFATLDYFNPERNHYAYKLEGFDEDWIFCGNQRFSRYTNVQPGTYKFTVKGSNNDDYWNETGSSIFLTIKPPPWRTWWAYLTYSVLLLVFVISWRIYDLRRLRLKQELEIEYLKTTKLEELDKLKSDFFANISHEFRTPLTLILGPLNNIMSKLKERKIRKDLEIMQRNALRLLHLIDQLLNLSKLESGKLKLKANKENIIATIKEYVQSFESLGRQRNIDLIFQSDKLDISMFIDKDKLEKIMYNLISNAFKFTHDGGFIEIQIKEEKDNSLKENEVKDVVVISVKDNGKGIRTEHLPYLFNRFYQADNSRSNNGIGLGLALTRELVELHQGKITVESQEGKGTKFKIVLPRQIDYSAIEEDKREEEVKDIEDGFVQIEKILSEDISITINQGEDISRSIIPEANNLPVILLVEDNTDLRKYIRNYYDETYFFVEAANGMDGLNMAFNVIPDVVISDVMMPVMNGYALCKKLKSDERTSHIPVILLTARASKESKIEGLKCGADDFIIKPFDTDELHIRIDNLIVQRRNLARKFTKNSEKIGLHKLLQLPESGIASLDQKFLLKTIDIVTKNMSDSQFSIEKLSNIMNLSRMQLHRKLIAITEHTPNRLIRNIRLIKAAELLSTGTGNVTEIAYEVGFNNLSYFAKCFKDQFGVSPSEYTRKA